MSRLVPDLYYSHVTAIEMRLLAERGVRWVLLDLDNTLVARDSAEAGEGVRAWLAALAEHGMHACIVSNNWHGHVYGVAKDLGVPIVAKALKPLPLAFTRALRILGGSPGATAVVGDQLFTDVLGGNLLGMTTVLVVPLTRSDLPHTLVLRRIERVILAGRNPLA